MTREIDQLQVQMEKILDLYIEVSELCQILHPMLFDQWTVSHYGQGDRARGFAVLKSTLYLACIQNIVAICVDKPGDTPTIERMINKLKKNSIRQQLRSNYLASFGNLQTAGNSVAGAKEAEFDYIYSHTVDAWKANELTMAIEKFKRARDKYIVHTKLHAQSSASVDATVYTTVDFSMFGLKVQEPWMVVNTLRPIPTSTNLSEVLTLTLRA